MVNNFCGQRLSPLEAFYMATLGGARALGLDDKIGNFLPGREADFTVLDGAPTRMIKTSPIMEPPAMPPAQTVSWFSTKAR